MLKDEFPKSGNLDAVNAAAAESAAAADGAANKGDAKAKSKEGGRKESAEDVADEDIEELEESESEDEDEKVDEKKEAKLQEVQDLRKQVEEAKMVIMKCHNATDDLDKEIEQKKKKASFYQAELAKHPKVPPPPTKEQVQQKEEEKMDLIQKYKRDLRVYKYTLDLTRVEWKKNQQLALEKMNAHRKVITKYKDDKTTLLSIVQDLEEKVAEANRRLTVGQQQQREANAMFGYVAPVDGMKSLDKHAANALANFMKTKPETSGSPQKLVSKEAC